MNLKKIAKNRYLGSVRFFIRNVIDVSYLLFTPIPKGPKIKGKRILILNWRDTRHKLSGGAEEYIHELAKRWVKEGNIVNIFCGNDGDSPRNETIDGIRIIRRGGFYFVYVWAFIYYILRLRGRFDIIIDAQNGIPFFTPLYAKEKKYCLMFHVHQKVFKKSLVKPLAIIASLTEKRIMPWTYRKTEFITISESSKKDMIKLGIDGNRIHVVFPGVDLKKLKPAQKAEKPTVLYLGRLKEYKSVDLFIKSAAKVVKKIPNAQFIIAGDGEEKEELINLSQRLGLKNKISFLGKVTEEEKVNLYQKAWVFVNPSYMEGWGMTTIEANACGTPVVASDVPGLRDSVNNPETGYLVKYGDIDGFVKKISFLLRDTKQRQNMSKLSVDWARNFAWSTSAKKSMGIIL